MYIVVKTIETIKSLTEKEYEDSYTAHDSIESARKEYQESIDSPSTFTASICGVIESSDYDPLYYSHNKYEIQTQAYITASGHFLTNPLPNDWEDMSEDDLNSFISDNLWEHFENCDPHYVFEHIDTLARDFLNFNKKHG